MVATVAVDSIPISELQDVLEVRLNWKIIHISSHAKDQNNTSDIIGITYILVSPGLNQTYWTLQYLYVQSLAN